MIALWFCFLPFKIKWSIMPLCIYNSFLVLWFVFFWNSGMTLSLVYISYAFEMFGLNFKSNRTVYEKQSYFHHCRRMKSHVPFVDFSAEALGWLILRFRWLPCLSQLSLTEPPLGARMELDSPFQRGFGSAFRPPARRELQTRRPFWDTQGSGPAGNGSGSTVLQAKGCHLWGKKR